VKCAACGYEGSSEDDFGFELFLSYQVYTDGIDLIKRIEGNAIRVFVCPKCMTLKMRTPEDEENEKTLWKSKWKSNTDNRIQELKDIRTLIDVKIDRLLRSQKEEEDGKSN
jgi:hypothetical protein